MREALVQERPALLPLPTTAFGAIDAEDITGRLGPGEHREQTKTIVVRGAPLELVGIQLEIHYRHGDRSDVRWQLAWVHLTP